ncbi:hypothetical protein [Oryzobacter telluris]|uniref:hypothetical protein n=1 Tax=Oryzobacter telluris TaxID=3149179 RepID=UPI00370D1E7B
MTTTTAALSPRPSNGTVVELLRRCGSGDTSALMRLYDIVSPLVYRLSLLVLGEEGMAQASTGRTFAIVWETAPGYDHAKDGTALPWLLSIAHGEARSQLG